MNIYKRLNVQRLIKTITPAIRESLRMSTRSSISVKNMEGTITTVYCHFDGYPSRVGKILLENYSEYHDALALVSLGGISSLNESIECPEGHSYDNQIDGYTVFYHRDRGEELRISYHDTIEDAWDESGQEYNYYHDTEKWHLQKSVPIPLEEILNEVD